MTTVVNAGSQASTYKMQAIPIPDQPRVRAHYQNNEIGQSNSRKNP